MPREKLDLFEFGARQVVSVIEVKSNLTRPELADGYAKVASCKRLKRRPMQAEELRTNRSGTFHGTTGIVFAFGSTLALETIIEHTKELNDECDSELWPEIIVVLDAGRITYAIQYPGAPKFAGSLMSVAYPPKYGKGGPPWYVHLALHADGEYTLNRFFMMLLSAGKLLSVRQAASETGSIKSPMPAALVGTWR